MRMLLPTVLIVFATTSCQIETAKPKTQRTLTIASDILTEADTLIFQKFGQSNNVRVRIVERNGDELIGDFRNATYSSGYDLLLLSSLYEFNKVYRLDLIQPNLDREVDIYDSKKHGFYGIAIDPFVIKYDSDSTLLIRSFSDLTKHSFQNKLAIEDEVPMLSSLLVKMNKVEAFEWIKKYDQMQKKRSWSNAVLIRYSEQDLLRKDSSFFNYTSTHYPRSRSNDVSYDLINISIVKQAENYKLADSLIAYVLQPGINKKLANHFKSISVSEGSNRTKYFRLKNEDLLQYYTMTERMLNKNR